MLVTFHDFYFDYFMSLSIWFKVDEKNKIQDKSKLDQVYCA